MCSLFPFRFYRLPAFLVLEIAALLISGFTDCCISHSVLILQILASFPFRALQIPSFLIPGFTDCGFSHSGFHTFRRFPFRVLQIRLFSFRVFTDSAFHILGFTDLVLTTKIQILICHVLVLFG